MMWIKIPTVSLLLHYLCRQLFGCVSQTNRKTRVSCGARIHFLLLQSFWRLLFYLTTHKNVFQVFNVCIVFELQTFVTQRINSRVSIYLLLWKPESSTLYFNIKEPDFLVFILKCSWAIILQVFWRLFSLDIGCFFNKFCHVISVVENWGPKCRHAKAECGELYCFCSDFNIIWTVCIQPTKLSEFISSPAAPGPVWKLQKVMWFTLQMNISIITEIV